MPYRPRLNLCQLTNSNIWDDVKLDNAPNLQEHEVRRRMALVEDCEEKHFDWFWLAWEDLFGLDECGNPEDAFNYITSLKG